MNRITLLCLVAGVLTTGSNHGAETLPPLDKTAAGKVSYRKDVWPILKRHCWGCHSAAKPRGRLNLDTVADMRKGGRNGPLFQPGKPDASLLVKSVIGDEPEMPKKKPPLSAAKIHILRQWILAGANDDSVKGGAFQVKAPATYQFAPAITSVALSADGKQVAAACRSEVVLLDVEGNSPPRRLATQCDLVTHVEFSPDGKLLAAVGGSPSRYGEVRFFNPADGKVVGFRRVGKDTLFRGGFAPNSQAIAAGGADGAVYIVPVDSKAAVRHFDLHSDWVLDVAYSPDGKMIVSGGRDKATKVSSVETGKLLRAVDNSTELISAVASDGQFAVSAGRNRQLISYEYKIALSGIQVSGAGNGARPINRRNQYAKAFEAQPGEVLDIAASGDRKRIAVAGNFGDVRIYQIADRKRIGLVSKVPAPIYSVALNAGGTRLAVGSKTGQVQVYDVPSGKLVKSLVPVPVATAGKQ